jgi:ABC-type nickel/cobalt efflux system permease component RcnA
MIILVVILLSIIAIYYLFKSEKKQFKYRGEKFPLANGDYNRVKTIDSISCLECGNCVLESSGCCANCNFQTDLVAESHCHEHNHLHSHNHYHKHDHSHSGSNKNFFSLLLIPLIVGVIVYRIIVSRVFKQIYS